MIRGDTAVTQATTIAGLEGTVTLAQLAALITQVQAQQANTGGGNIGDGTEAVLQVGPGLSGGGPMLGTVRLNLTAPIPWGLDDSGGGGDGDPGPPGLAGPPGINGVAGGTGPPGPAIYLAAEDGEDGWHAIPGNAGPQGIQGTQGPQGIQGSGNGSSAGLLIWVPDDVVTDEELYRGPVSARGPLTVNGAFVVNSTASINGDVLLSAAASRTISFLGNTANITAASTLNINAVGTLNFNNNGVVALSGSSGHWTIPNPGTGGGGSATLSITAQSTAGQSRGVIVSAGANSADYALVLANAAGTQLLFEVYGDGGVTVGPNTVADKGTGTVNILNGYYVGGALVAGGANLTPGGAHHGMIADDNYPDEEIYRGPSSVQGATTINGPSKVNGSFGVTGVLPPVTPGQTDLGTTTTVTVISTAGGIGIPLLASTFWVVNVNGVSYGVPCFAL